MTSRGDTAPPIADRPAGGLVVEDEPLMRELIVEELTDHGFQVLAADSGERGLEILRAGATVDVLFTDIRLPGAMDGWHLAQAGRKESPDLRVVYATGYTVERTMQVPGSVFVTKPYRPSVVADTIRTLLAG